MLKQTVTDGPWLETRSEICSAGRYVNLSLGELLINLLELRVKLVMVCIRYIEALDRGLVPTLRVRTSSLLTQRE